MGNISAIKLLLEKKCAVPLVEASLRRIFPIYYLDVVTHAIQKTKIL